MAPSLAIGLLLAASPAKAPAKKPPAAEVVLRAVFANQDLKFSQMQHCEPDPTGSQTLGTYIAKLLAVFTEDGGRRRRNWIRATCKAAKDGAAPWLCEASLFMETIPRSEHMLGGWGVMFKMGRNGEALRDSFVCVGTG
jgi:hypothetical protein